MSFTILALSQRESSGLNTDQRSEYGKRRARGGSGEETTMVYDPRKGPKSVTILGLVLSAFIWVVVLVRALGNARPCPSRSRRLFLLPWRPG